MEITHVGVILFVAHYPQCVAFYRDQIRLPVLQTQPTLTSFAFGSGYLMVEQGGVSGGIGEKSRTHNPTVLRFNVSDVVVTAQTLRQRGVHVEVLRFDWGVIGVFTDPDGHRCELMQQPQGAAPCP